MSDLVGTLCHSSFTCQNKKLRATSSEFNNDSFVTLNNHFFNAIQVAVAVL